MNGVPQIAIVLGYRGGDLNWAVQVGDSEVTPAEMPGFVALLDEATAAASLLNDPPGDDSPITRRIRERSTP